MPPLLFGEFVGMTVFFVSDTHFNHRRIIDYCVRPFGSVKEMNQGIIERWNSIVHDDDTVFHLGDVYFLRMSEKTSKASNMIEKISSR